MVALVGLSRLDSLKWGNYIEYHEDSLLDIWINKNSDTVKAKIQVVGQTSIELWGIKSHSRELEGVCIH